MSAWKAGDKAVCVESFLNKDIDSLQSYVDGCPVKGTTYLVSGVVSRTSQRLSRDVCGLEIEGLTGAWLSTRFRKIVTATERAAIEAEQTGLIPHENFWSDNQ